MKPQDLKSARRRQTWSQQELADRLGLSQSYVAMMENGDRKLAPSLVRKVARLLKLPPTVLPHSLPEESSTRETMQSLAEQLASLGYPGFAYLRTRLVKRNPDEVLLSALAQPELEARLVEALPWVLLSYPNVDASWLVRQAKVRDLQNRLGFVVSLARQVAENKFPGRVEQLKKLEDVLELSRLAKEDTLCRAALTPAEERWLRDNRSQCAKDWNLLTDWRAETLRYDA